MGQVRRDGDGNVVLASERLRALVGHHEPELVAEVAGLERLANSRTVAIAANGKFPRWSLERWLTLVTLIVTSSGVIGFLWFASREWYGVKFVVSTMQEQVTQQGKTMKELDASMQNLRIDVLTIQRADEYFRSNPRGTAVGQ